MISGAFDKTVSLLDVRQAEKASSCSTDSDIEMLKWNPHNPAEFAVATESGKLPFMMLETSQRRCVQFKGHNKAVSSISFSAMVPGLFATASVDKTVKLWDLDGEQTELRCIKVHGCWRPHVLQFLYE